MKYFKSHWDESRGDEYDHWGNCWYYFEISTDNYARRQIEKYENNNSLKYDLSSHSYDKYGFLTDQPFDISENYLIEIDKNEFENEWKQSGYIDGNEQWSNA